MPAELERYPDFQPARQPPRNTRIAGVLLTNADLDHALGLLSLREGEKLNIYATSSVRRTLDDSLRLGPVLEAFCGVAWHETPMNEFAPLPPEAEGKSGLSYRAIVLSGKPPPFARDKAPPTAQSVAYQFLDQKTGGRLLVAPDVADFNKDLLKALADSEVVLFDGTFWSADELAGVKSSAPKAGQMGHVTIKDGSLKVLAGLRARHKVYIHVNNTNPILLPGSPERSAVEAAGIAVGSDGMEFEL